MSPSYTFQVMLVDASRVDATGTDRIWLADESAAASDAMAAHNRRLADRLMERLPDLQVAGVADEDLTEYVEPGLPAEVTLRRYHRSQTLQGRWQSGWLAVRLFDGIAELSITAAILAGSAARNQLERDLSTLLRAFAEATGYVPKDARTAAVMRPEAMATALMLQHARGLGRLARAASKERLYRLLGVPSMLLLTILALGATIAPAVHAIRHGTLMAGVDPSRTLTFVTSTHAPPRYRLGVFPQLALNGTVAETREVAQVDVYRDVYISAGPSARYAIHATKDPQTPYVLKSSYASAQPVIGLGRFGVQWHVLLAAIPAGAWYWLLLRPWLRTPPDRRTELLVAATSVAVTVVGLGALVVAIAVLKRI